MKKLALALGAALIVLPSFALAQGRPGGPGGPGGGNFQQRMAQRQKEQRDRFIKELKLSPDQVKKLDALHKKMGDKRRKVFESMGIRPGGPQAGAGNRAGGPPTGGARAGGQAPPNRDAMRKAMEKLRDEERAEMKKILNAQQFATFEKMMKEMAARRRQGGPGGGPGGPGGPAGAGGAGKRGG